MYICSAPGCRGCELRTRERSKPNRGSTRSAKTVICTNQPYYHAHHPWKSLTEPSGWACAADTELPHEGREHEPVDHRESTHPARAERSRRKNLSAQTPIVLHDSVVCPAVTLCKDMPTVESPPANALQKRLSPRLEWRMPV